MSFLNYEKENNKLLVALRTQKEYAPMVDVLTREKTAAILAPQDVTIEEAILNQDFVQTHLVLFNPSDERQFVSLNGVQGLLSLGYDELFILSPGLQSSEERIRFFHDSYSVFSSPSVYDRASDDKFVRSCPRIQVLRVSSMDFRGQTVDLLVIAQPIPHVVTGTSHVSSLSSGSHSSVSSNSSVSSSSSSSSVTAAMEVQSRPVLPSHTDVADDMENPLALSKRAAEGAFGTRECIAAIKKHEEVMTKISNFCNTLLSLAGPNSSMDADAAAVHSFLLSLENSFTTVFPEDPAVCADGSSPPLSTASSTSSMSSTSTVGSSAVSETIDPPHSPGITHNRDSLRDVYRDAVERLVMRRLHDHFSDVFRRKDAEIFDHCETLLARLKPEHILLDAPIDVTEDAVQKAIRELRRIPNFKTPRDRSICITNCCRLLFTVLGHGAGADEFFPLLTYCVMQARVPSWLSTLWYIEKLRHPLRIGGEHEYYLASTRSAVVFLQSMNVDEVIRKDEEHRARKRMLQPVLGIVYGATTSSSTPSSKEDSQDFLHIHPATKFEDLSIAELRTVWERYVQIEKWLRPYK